MAIGLAAVNTGNNLLYLMLSLVLGLAASAKAASLWSTRRLRLTIHLPDQVRCGEPFPVTARVRGRFPMLSRTWVRVSLEGLSQPVRLNVPVALDAGDGLGSVHVTVHRRGLYENLTARARPVYPIDFSSSLTRPEPAGCLVVLPSFPRLSSFHVTAIGGETPRREDHRPAYQHGRGSELHDIREYRHDDDARRIEWRSSARTGRLMVRESECDQQPRQLDLLLDTEAPSADAFEPVVSLCAALLDLAHRDGMDARLIAPAGGRILTGRAALRHLATVQATPPGSASAQLQRARASVRPHADRIVLSAMPGHATPIEVR